MSARAVIIGCLLTPLMITWSVYSDIVAQSAELATLSLSIGVVFVLVVLLAINSLLKRFAMDAAFSQGELLTIYSMLIVSIGISGAGWVEFIVPTLGNVYYFATPQNGWAVRYHHFLKPWAFPDPKVIDAMYIGHSSFFTREHVLGWLSPIMFWTGFVLAALCSTLCLAAILRKRWVDDEKLSFPIVILPIELTRDDAGTRLLRNRMFWIGFAAAFTVEVVIGLSVLFPGIPSPPIKPSDPRLQIGTYHILTQPPWWAMNDLTFGLYPTVIGLTYFLPLDVSFSCWFFYLLRKSEDVFFTGVGFYEPGAPLVLSRFPYYGEQGLGGFFGLAIFALWGARGYLAEVWRSALGKGTTDEQEPMAYRWAFAGAAISFAAMVAFAVNLGVGLFLALAFMAMWLLLVVGYTRIRAEAGLPWAYGPDMTPHQLIAAGMGTSRMSDSQMVGLAEFQWVDLDYRCTPMPPQLECMKIATEAGLQQRRLTGAIMLATAIGATVSWIAILSLYYRYGAASAHVDPYRTNMGTSPWQILDSWKAAPANSDWPRVIAVLLGLAITGLLAVLRSRFVAWPLHPIGYVLAGGFTLVWLWFPLFLGWLLKWSILRYGGMRLYRKFMPLCIGLILGDYISAALWALIGTLTGTQTYKVLPM